MSTEALPFFQRFTTSAYYTGPYVVSLVCLTAALVAFTAYMFLRKRYNSDLAPNQDVAMRTYIEQPASATEYGSLRRDGTLPIRGSDHGQLRLLENQRKHTNASSLSHYDNQNNQIQHFQLDAPPAPPSHTTFTFEGAEDAAYGTLSKRTSKQSIKRRKQNFLESKEFEAEFDDE